jgi:hypothetical protein
LPLTADERRWRNLSVELPALRAFDERIISARVDGDHLGDMASEGSVGVGRGALPSWYRA